MADANWQKVREVFDAALRQKPEARQNYINEACGSDKDLLTEVESLFSSFAKVDDFMETPAVAQVADIIEFHTKTLETGTRFGRYEVIRQIDRGGMGEVYLAEDARLGRRVALKLLPAHFTQDKGHLRRFEQEARAVAALSHPNVCVIHEVIETGDGRQGIVMEYVEGVTLRARIAETGMNVREALDVVIQVASALAAAHAAGIVHRDIKPENIMLRSDGYVKVLDFGLAKLTERQAAATDVEARKITQFSSEVGVVMGTVGYMSPEQARALAVDARTDIWSLGVVLYEVLAGQQPFQGATPTDVIISIVEREPEPLTKHVPEVPIRLERIVKKTLAKDREERYQTAADLLIELKNLGQELEFEAEVKRSKQAIGPEPTGIPRQSSETGAIPEASTRAVYGNQAARTFRRALLVLVPLVVVAVAYALFTRDKQLPPRLNVASIVVLPLENLSGEPAEEYFADGMTDALIGDLAKIAELHVISRTSSMHYKRTKKSLPEIASELKVDAVVEGTVQRSGERVRVRAQLIHAATDRHLWVETYERDVRNIFELQSEIAQAIAREVQIKISPAEEARLKPRSPVKPKAFDEYLQGRHLFWNRRTVENLHKAIEHFQSAIREDSSYALPYVGLADCYNALGSVQIGTLPPRDARQRAEKAAVKALELDPALAEAHGALAYVKHFNWEWDAAEQEFKRAIELNPNNASARNSYASYLMCKGRVEEALVSSNRARELDPFSLSISVQRGFILENARRYDESIEQLNRVLAMDQNNYQAHWMLGHTYAMNGQFDRGIATAERAVALSERSPGALGMLGMIYGLAGRKAEANKILKELLELNERRYVTPAALCYVYIGLGDKDQAFVWLEKAFEERSYFIAWLKTVPVADPLRSDPRFDDLLRRVGHTQ